MKAQHYQINVWDDAEGRTFPQSLLYFPGKGMIYVWREGLITGRDPAFRYIAKKEWYGYEALEIENEVVGREYLGDVDIPDALAHDVLALGEKALQAGENFTRTAKTLMDLVK